MLFIPRRSALTLCLALAMPLIAQSAPPKTVVDAAALSDQKQGANWLAYGRNFYEQRYSPLTQIDTDSVAKLGLQWSMPLPDDHSLLGTPIVVDGVTRSIVLRSGEDSATLINTGPERPAVSASGSPALAAKGK